MRITKGVIPAAGLGTRFLPITKSIPKEMLPLMNKPALEYIVEEGLASGINHFCMVVSETKGAIKDFFSPNQKLAADLAKVQKTEWTQSIDSINKNAQFSYVIQPEMRGLGDAILMARGVIQPHESFSVILPDDMMFGDEPAIKQLIEVAQRENATILAMMEVPLEEIGAYGCVKIKQTLSNDLVEIEDIIEKPKPGEAFSNLAIIGRYVGKGFSWLWFLN